MIVFSPNAGGFVKGGHYVPSYGVFPLSKVIVPGSSNEVIHQDASLIYQQGATVEYTARIESPFEAHATLTSLDPGIAIIDSEGVVNRVSNGRAQILASSPPDTQKFPVDVRVEEAQDITIFDHWIEGTAARLAADEISDMIDGVVASDSTKNIYSGSSRNPLLFCAKYADALTAIASSTDGVPGNPWMGFTSITQWHIVACAHIGDYSGRAVVWRLPNGTAESRKLVKAYFIPGRDTAIYILDRALPGSISPMNVLPEDVTDYVANPKFPVDLLFSDRSNQMNLGVSTSLNDAMAGISAPNISSDRYPFYTYPRDGTSGKPILLAFGDGPTDLALWGTFTGPAYGPSYHTLDWPAILSALELSANRFSGAPVFKSFTYLQARTAPFFRDDIPGFYDEFSQLKECVDNFPWDLSGTTTRAIIYISDKPSTGTRTALQSAMVAKGIRFYTSATYPANADFAALALATGGSVKNNYATLVTQAQAEAAWSNIFPGGNKLQLIIVFNQSASNSSAGDPVDHSKLTAAFRAALPALKTNYESLYSTVEWGYAITDFDGIRYMTTGAAVQPQRADLSAFTKFP